MDLPSLSPLSWRGEAVSRLILGTAQLGMDYGVANAAGRPDTDRARAIVDAAWACGVRHFDTAQAYGESESVLGTALDDLGIAKEARICTKIAPTVDGADADAVATAVRASLARLGVPRLWAVLLHRAEQREAWDRGLGDALRRLQAEGVIAHLGCSLSPPGDAARVLDASVLEVLQAPCNGWDRRLIAAGFFEAARATDRLVCVRSIYLQGLLLMPPEKVPARLAHALPAVKAWHGALAAAGLDGKTAAARFAAGLGTPLVVGAESPAQVIDTARLLSLPPLDAATEAALTAPLEKHLSADVLEPWRWPEA